MQPADASSELPIVVKNALGTTPTRTERVRHGPRVVRYFTVKDVRSVTSWRQTLVSNLLLASNSVNPTNCRARITELWPSSRLATFRIKAGARLASRLVLRLRTQILPDFVRNPVAKRIRHPGELLRIQRQILACINSLLRQPSRRDADHGLAELGVGQMQTLLREQKGDFWKRERWSKNGI